MKLKPDNKMKKHFALRFVTETLAMTAGILLTFALFHHVLPICFSRQGTGTPAELVPVAAAIPLSTPAPMIGESEETPEPRFHPPENATAWQWKFAEHSTDEVTVTENSYTSPNLSLTITTHNEDLGRGNVRWHVCDIYVASTDNFRTAFAYDLFRPYVEQDILEMMSAHNAILAMSGDSCLRQDRSLVVRNGYVYSQYPTAADYLLLFADGSMKTFVTAETDLSALLAGEGEQQVLQSWHFGPSLLDEAGRAKTDFTAAIDKYVMYEETHPRCGIGYYEPGHYCLLLAEGRLEHSVGVTVQELAQLFEREGCALAYNLDGGRTAVLGFNSARFSVQSNRATRLQNDIVYFTDVPPAAVGEEERHG